MFINKAIIIAASLFVASSANAAEYIVKQGDTLVSIAEKTGHTPEQIVIMNSKHDWAMFGLAVGTKLTYVSKQDLRRANRWCQTRLRELPAYDPNVPFFEDCVANTRSKKQENIRYTFMQSSGTHYELVGSFSQAYKKVMPSEITSSLASTILAAFISGPITASLPKLAPLEASSNSAAVTDTILSSKEGRSTTDVVLPSSSAANIYVVAPSKEGGSTVEIDVDPK